VLKNKGVIFINEVRCFKCEKLLYRKFNVEAGALTFDEKVNLQSVSYSNNTVHKIECKCPRCGAINTNNDGIIETIPAIKNVNRKQVFITPEVCKQKIIDELNSKYSNLIIKGWGEINIGGFRPFTKCKFEGTLISKK